MEPSQDAGAADDSFQVDVQEAIILQTIRDTGAPGPDWEAIPGGYRRREK